MPHEDDVLGKADALMSRHRSFVARSADSRVDEPPDSMPDDVDVPVLTEIVETNQAGPLTLDALLDGLQDDLRDELSNWLVEVLPVAVANASQQILAELDAKARNTLMPRIQQLVEARRDPAAQDPSV